MTLSLPDVTRRVVKVLIYNPGLSGDALVSTAVLPGLRAQYPGAALHYQGQQGHTWPMLYNPHLDDTDVLGDLAMLRRRFDVVIDLQHADRWNKTMLMVHCDLAGVPFHPPELFLSPEEEQQANQRNGFIAVWQRASFADRCYDEIQTVVDAFPREHFVQVEKVGPEWRLRGAEYWGDLPLRETVVRMKGAKLAVGVDTIFMHAAALWRVPMALALGPTSHLTQYLPDASILYGDRSRFAPQVGVNGDPHDVKPGDLIDALAERLAGRLAGKNPRIVYTDDNGVLERVDGPFSRLKIAVRALLRRSLQETS